jgi:hypothetical protein
MYYTYLPSSDNPEITMKRKSASDRCDQLVSPSNKTVYVFETGMTSEEKARGISDASYQRSGIGTACVVHEFYKIVHVSAKPNPIRL